MLSPHRRHSRVSQLLIAVFGCVAMTSMLWTIQTENQLADVFWPGDIHVQVVAALGGTASRSPSGIMQTDLAWSSVVARVSGILVIAGVLISLVRRTPQAQATVRPRNTLPDRLLSIVAQIAFPWCFAAVWLLMWVVSTSVVDPGFLSFLVTTTPLWMALIMAAALNNLVSAVFPPDDGEEPVQHAKSWREFSVVVVAILCWEAVSFWMNERLYAGLMVPHGDSAMYEEHLWNVWHGKGFRSYLDQGLFLGEHIQVIHLLLLPLHMLWPSYLLLELCASLSLAVCAIPIFSIARRHSLSPRAAMWLALAWLLFFPMHFLDIAIDLKTLRPSCYGMPFLFWGIDFAERRRLIRSSLCLLTALSTQEDFALIVGPISFVLFLTSRGEPASSENRRFSIWSLTVFAFSIVYLLLAVLVVIPAFRGGDVVHYSRYFGDLGNSPGDLIRTAVRNPERVLSIFLSWRTAVYVLVLTIPLGLWPLRRPRFLLAGAATFLMLSLIQLGNEAGVTQDAESRQSMAQLPPVPFHHFHAPLLPVLLWAAAAALRPSGSPPTQHHSRTRHSVIADLWKSSFCGAIGRARFAFFCAVGTAVTGSMMPCGANFWSSESPMGWSKLYVQGRRAVEFEKVLADLPSSARVASTDYVHTRLTHFERSYDYSDYLRAVNNYQPGVPADTDYIVIDTSHPYSQIHTPDQVRELKAEPESWELLPDKTGGLFIVLKRRSSSIAAP